MSNFYVIIKYKDCELQYKSKNDKLELSGNDYTDMNIMKERAIKILVDSDWNERLTNKKTSH